MSIGVDVLETRIKRAALCTPCEEKRTVIEVRVERFGYVRRWGSVCAPCLLELLTRLIGPGRKRKVKP